MSGLVIMHRFLRYRVEKKDRQTDRQTGRPTNAGENASSATAVGVDNDKHQT